MNLLEKYFPKEHDEPPKDTYTISDFREVQYSLIPELIRVSMNYLHNISKGYYVFKRIREQGMIKYLDAYGYLVQKLSIIIEDPEDRENEQTFLSFNLPRLIKKSFFFLNGAYYCPGLYLLDKPITYKKNSIKLYSLMNSITLYFKVGNTRAIFGGRNIPIEYFLQWFLKDKDLSLLEQLEEQFKINSTRYSSEQLLEYFSNFFNCSKNEETINSYFDLIFFDDHTKRLYQESYERSFEFKELIYYSILNYIEGERVSFVDLTEKRLVFTEMILLPFFQRLGDMAFNFIRGQRFTAINFNENEILKFFMVELKHQFFYDLVNFYSGILVQKASFVHPNMKKPPSEISSVHPSHFKRICPITISAKKPGESVSIVPGARVNKYGIFL